MNSKAVYINKILLGGRNMKKKLLAITLCLAMTVSAMAGCGSKQDAAPADTGSQSTDASAQSGGEKDAAPASSDSAAPADASGSGGGDLEGAHVLLLKAAGTFTTKIYEGYSDYMESHGYKTAEKSPTETTVAAQVQIIDELITQKVASITIATNGDAGYDEVFKKAKEAGVIINSVDSACNPEFRTIHVNQASSEALGAYQVRAAVLQALGVDYPGDNMEKAVDDALAAYTGDELRIGVLSASIDTPVQNGWIADMEKELQRPCYQGKVSHDLDKKYGNDDLTASTTQAQAFMSENKVDVIIAPTTVGLAAQGQVLKQAGSDMKVTGLGVPSEMQAFMPLSSDENAFDYVCPYMMLWDLGHLGALSAAATLAVMNDGYDGKEGSTFTMDAWGDYPETTFTAIPASDGGTEVIMDDPYVFYKDNMADWINKM